jgi:hypothetical protein
MMTTNPKPDNAIDKVLAALRDAAPPEGMESRIAARLEQHTNAQQAHARPNSHWRSLLTGQSLAAAWFRGAATGVAFALLAVAAVLALRHTPAPPPQQTAAAPSPAHITPVSEARTTPCISPAVLRVHRAATTTAQPVLLAKARVDTAAPSHPAPPLPLTAQERELVRMARIADPQQLATINPETQAKLLAQQAAEFDKFFASQPAPPAPATHE